MGRRIRKQDWEVLNSDEGEVGLGERDDEEEGEWVPRNGKHIPNMNTYRTRNKPLLSSVCLWVALVRTQNKIHLNNCVRNCDCNPHMVLRVIGYKEDNRTPQIFWNDSTSWFFWLDISVTTDISQKHCCFSFWICSRRWYWQCGPWTCSIGVI